MYNQFFQFIEDDSNFTKSINEFARCFYISTGIKVFVTDSKGNKKKDCGESHELCNVIIENKENRDICRECHLYGGKKSRDIGDGYIFYCPAGLVHIAVPIIKNNKFEGSIIAGPIIMDESDDIVNQINKNYNISSDSLEDINKYIRDIIVVNPERVQCLSHLLFISSLSFSADDKFNLKENNKKMHQQSEIGEVIHTLKDNSNINEYPYETEKQLFIQVKNGDAIAAKATLNKLLAYVFFAGGGNIEIMKARSLELSTLLSRAAVEGGAELNDIFGMNYKFIEKLSKVNSIEDLSYWMVKILDRFIQNVFVLSNCNNGDILNEAINYINKNYMNDINLELVASYVHLNPSYFSTIFKRQTKMKFSDYLNKVRIEQSKKILENGNDSILEIALRVGFEDQSYYSKVFKKNTGITPYKYKIKYKNSK